MLRLPSIDRCVTTECRGLICRESWSTWVASLGINEGKARKITTTRDVTIVSTMNRTAQLHDSHSPTISACVHTCVCTQPTGTARVTQAGVAKDLPRRLRRPRLRSSLPLTPHYTWTPAHPHAFSHPYVRTCPRHRVPDSSTTLGSLTSPNETRFL